MNRLLHWLSAVALAATAGLGQVPRAAAADYGEAVAQAERLGQALYQKDRAAWVATDELQRRGVLAGEQRVRGWVTEEVHGIFRVNFMGGSLEAPLVYYQVDIGQGRVVQDSFLTFKDGATPSPQAVSMWKARTTALAGSNVPCEGNYNTVVLPSGGDAVRPNGYYVYLLWATTDPQVMNIGGHLRVETTPDGARVLATKSFSNSCFAMQKQSEDVPPGTTVAALVVTHVLAPTPEENHVFVSMAHNQKLIVGTEENHTLWAVNDGRIAFLKQL